MSTLASVHWLVLLWFLACVSFGLFCWNRLFHPRLEWRWAAVLLAALAPLVPLARRDLVYGPFDTNVPLLPWAETGTVGYRPHNARLNDLTLQALPWQTEARRQLLEGRLPLLNPYSGAGQPLLGNAQTASFISLLAIPFEPLAAQALRALLVTWLALAGAYLVARQLGCSAGAAVLGGVAYAYSGSLTVWRLFPHTEVMALMPYAFLASERLLVSPEERSSRVLLVVALAGIGLAGHPETAFTAALGLASRWAWVLLRGPRDGVRRRAVGVGLVCSLFAVAGTAFFVLPVAQSVLGSEKLAREGWGQDQATAAKGGSASLAGLLDLAVPGVYGTPQGAGEAGPAPLHWLVEGSVGIIALVLVPVALAGRGRPHEMTFFLVLLAAAALALHLDPLGLFGRITALPLLSVLAPRYFAYLASFALALLAGLGLDRWMAREERTRVAAAAGLAVAAILAVTSYALARGWLQRTGAGVAVIGESARHARVALAVLAAAAVALRLRRPKLGALLLAALTVIQMADALGRYTPLVPRRNAYPAVPLLERLRAERGPFRLIGTRGVLPPNASTFYRLADVRAHDPTQPVRYSDWLHDFLDVDISHAKRQYPGPRRAHLPYLRLLGTRFLLSSADRRFEPPWIDRGLFRRTRLWELPGEVRWAFFPDAVIPAADARQARQRLREARRPLRVATLEAGGGPPVAASNGHGRVLRCDVDGDRLRIGTEVREDAWLVVSQMGLSGWRARGDGKPLRTAMIDGALLGVRVPRGTRVVTLRYLPATWVAGCALSATAWLFGLALLVQRSAGQAPVGPE